MNNKKGLSYRLYRKKTIEMALEKELFHIFLYNPQNYCSHTPLLHFLKDSKALIFC